MRRILIRRIISGVLALGLGAGLVVAGSTPAAEAAVIAPAMLPADTSLGGNAPKGIRAWMLNILGSVLKGATPNSWQREQLANANRVNIGWETLDAEFGYKSSTYDASSGMIFDKQGNLIPQTSAEYNMKRAELEREGRFTKSNGEKVGSSKPMQPPATKPSKLSKAVGGVGGGVMAVTGFAFGTAIGNFGLSIFGFDVDGAVCGNTEGVGQVLASLVTGADCNAWALAPEWEPNADVVIGTTSGSVCNAAGTQCVRVVGVVLQNAQGSTSMCMHTTTGPLTYAMPWIQVNGSWQRLSSTQRFGGVYGNSAGCVTVTGVTDSDAAKQYAAITSGVLSSIPTRLAWDSGPMPGSEAGVPIIATDPDPLRTLTCSITGSDGLTYTQESPAYRESDGSISSPECPALPEGVAPANVTINENSLAGTTEVYNEDVTEEYLDWWNAYPECRTGACTLDLVHVGTGTSCFDLDEICVDWFTSPNRASEYQCTYGVHDVDIEECFVYSGVFSQARRAIGAPYSDPMTGDWSGGTNAPSPDAQAMGQAVQSPNVARSCNGMAALGFDPVAWVMRPVQCALEWAFVPRPAVLQLQQAEVEQEWNKTGAAKLAGAVASWDLAPTASGCAIPVTIPMPFIDEFSFNVVDGCPGSVMEPLTVISRTLINISLVVLVIMVLRRCIGGAVDFR